MKKITLILLLFFGYIHSQNGNYNIKNISENTKFADFGVTYYGDSLAVFASSRPKKTIRNRTWGYNNQPFLDLYEGNLTKDGEIINIKNFSENINTKYHESNVVFTKDLKTVYFSRNNYIANKISKDEEGWVLIQLFKAKVGENGEWTDITPMPFNSDNYQTGHPTLNGAEDKLYFTSDMPGTIGSTDIFVVSINEDGSYGTPINLGSNVNSPGKEMFPFISNNNILYFSSNGRYPGKEDLDIYATKIVEGQAAYLSKSLSFPINSNYDDFSLVFKPGVNWGHFSSNRPDGQGDDDIYYFEELETITFDCEQVVAGVVRDNRTGTLLSGAKVDLFDADGNILESTITDDSANFSFNVSCSTAYRLVGSKLDYRDEIKVFTTSELNKLELASDLYLTSTDFVTNRGKLMVNIDPIYFDLDKSDIRLDAAIELEKVVKVMKKYPNLMISSGSHTDSRGSDVYNMKLSDRRAKSTVAWIIKRGIDASRISGQGYGETELVNDCTNGVVCSEYEHQLNRRTEFVILNPEAIKE